ncbi:acyl-coenzyme A thioesterase 5-like [Conger conger]|uniref:acyl-coenzyme A thioesterase 5-like n=1 Tax=Conger conger TaxID=82655 RepID=UPI002A5A3345|nr:acyl-coenzyme A thioesterase 5-like [Conger conger]
MLPFSRFKMYFARSSACFKHAGRCFLNTNNGPTYPPVKFNIKPDYKCLFDTPVHIKVEGLRPKQQVIFRATLTDEKQVKFVSSADFEVDDRGVLDLAQSAALGGDYSGVHPMGFMWAMKAQSDLGRLIRKDITSPFKVLLSVHDKTSCEKDARPLASCIHERGFLGDGVRRIPVREGRIRAILFLPPGEGPFPGVLELGGTAGGMLESRACLLANHGFATLCLAYFSYDDLPKRLLDLHLEYFEEALQYFQNVPQVRKGGVGIMGISKGADLALSMASFLPGVRAVVSVNGCNANLQCPLHYGELTLQGLGLDAERIVIRESGVLNVRHCYHDPRAPENAACLIPIERASARFLFVIAQDDQVWDAEVYARQAEEQLLSHGRSRPEILLLPGAGHLLEPPYFPSCSASFHKFVGTSVEWGGAPVSHSAAQEKYWQRIREFFLENLGGAGPSKL